MLILRGAIELRGVINKNPMTIEETIREVHALEEHTWRVMNFITVIG